MTPDTLRAVGLTEAQARDVLDGRARVTVEPIVERVTLSTATAAAWGIANATRRTGVYAHRTGDVPRRVGQVWRDGTRWFGHARGGSTDLTSEIPPQHTRADAVDAVMRLRGGR